MVAGELEDGLAEVVLAADVAFVESCAGLRDYADAFGVAFGKLGDIDVYYASGIDGHELFECFEAVDSALFEIAGDAWALDGQTHCYGWDAKKGSLHCGSDCPGVVDVYSDVCSVVNSRYEQVYGAFAKLHTCELHTVCGRALDAVSCEEAVDIDLGDDERLAECDAVACARLGGVRCDYSYVGDFDELFVDRGQARCEDAIVVC